MPDLWFGILFTGINHSFMNTAARPIILFDGVCNFCNGAINFLIRQDRTGQLLFAPLQSSAGQALLQQYGLPTEQFGSFVLIKSGNVYQKSSAALQVVPHLPWYWQWAKLGALLPVRWRDGLYDFIARNRYRWFGKQAVCMVPTKEVRARFLS